MDGFTRTLHAAIWKAESVKRQRALNVVLTVLGTLGFLAFLMGAYLVYRDVRLADARVEAQRQLFGLEAQILWGFAKIKEQMALQIQGLQDKKASTDELRKVANGTRDKTEAGLENIKESIIALDKKVTLIEYRLDETRK